MMLAAWRSRVIGFVRRYPLHVGCAVVGALVLIFSPHYAARLPNPWSIGPAPWTRTPFTNGMARDELWSKFRFIEFQETFAASAEARSIVGELPSGLQLKHVGKIIEAENGFPFRSGKHTTISYLDPCKPHYSNCLGYVPTNAEVAFVGMESGPIYYSLQLVPTLGNAGVGTAVGALVAFPLSGIVRRFRRRPGHCRCGYEVLDLVRCPECGEAR